MTVPSGGKVKVRSIVASLVTALMLVPGCRQDEGEAPPNPVPRSDGAGGTKGISDVEKDLRKDLGGGPLIKPDAPATTAPPTAKPDTAKTGQP
jgi:hypothetical protein